MATRQESTASTIVRDCLKEYGSYAIEDRAVADVRDGLKPSQRRILYALHVLKRHSKDIPVKCAAVVGTTMAAYHPHGDAAIYDTLINLHWMSSPLVQRKGNFGNRKTLIETSYAAMRYTETRLTEFADRLFDDIAIVPMTKSFNEENDEPIIFLPRVPLLLVNGSAGVAVGLSANIPPHNLQEVIDASLHVLRNPNCTTKDLLEFIKGPDHGGGVITSNKADLLSLYETGQGKIQYTCGYTFEEGKSGTKKLVITSFAPGFRKAKFLDDTTELANNRLLVDAAQDEGSLERGTRITVEFTDPKIINERVLPLLKSSSSYQFYALGAGKKPKLFTLKRIIETFLSIRRRTEKLVLQRDLTLLRERKEADLARLCAVDNSKVVYDVISNADTTDDAKAQLKSKLNINERQADIILNTPLRTLMKGNNRDDIVKKIETHNAKEVEINNGLNNIDDVVASRLQEMSVYSTKRVTKLRSNQKEVDDTISETTYFIGVTAQAKIESFDQPPVKSRAAWNYVDLVSTPSTFVVVSQDNVGQIVKLSYLDKFDSKIGQVVGVASGKHKCVVSVSKNGQYVAFDTEQRRNKFPVFKTLDDDTIFQAVGMNDGDRLVVVTEDGKQCQLGLDDLKVTRPNVASRSVFKRSNVTVSRVLVLRSGELLVRQDGSEVGSGKIKPDEKVMKIGAQNIVVLQDGRRLQKNQNEALDLLINNGVANVIPLEV